MSSIHTEKYKHIFMKLSAKKKKIRQSSKIEKIFLSPSALIIKQERKETKDGTQSKNQANES